MNSKEEYGSVAKWLHWLIGVMFLGALLLAATFWPLDSSVSEDVTYFFKWIHLHKSLGVTVLVLTFVRLYWRRRNIVPELPGSMVPWQVRLSQVTHYALYTLTVAVPLTGFIGNDIGSFTFRFFYLFKMPFLTPKNEELGEAIYDVHVILGWTTAALLALHIAAALLHHFYYRDDILVRMLPRRRQTDQQTTAPTH